MLKLELGVFAMEKYSLCGLCSICRAIHIGYEFSLFSSRRFPKGAARLVVLPEIYLLLPYFFCIYSYVMIRLQNNFRLCWEDGPYEAFRKRTTNLIMAMLWMVVDHSLTHKCTMPTQKSMVLSIQSGFWYLT